jgi:hypothetical protein
MAASVSLALLLLGLALALGGVPRAGAGTTGPALVASPRLVGLSQTESGGADPPDVQVAAGSGYVVEVVNTAMRVWLAADGAPAELSTRPLDAVFGRGSDDLTDPRILYDAPSARWFASISDVAQHAVLLAVSADGDPSGSWSAFSFQAKSDCLDQPRLGISDDVVVLAADLFASCTEADLAPVGDEVWTVNKAQLLAGSASPDVATFGPTTAYETLTPVQSLSPTSTEYLVSVDEPASNVAHLLTVRGIPPGPVTIEEIATPSISPLSPPPRALEPSTVVGRTATIATNDDRVLDASWEHGRLWFPADTGCVPAGDVALRACARVAELSTTTGALDWQEDIGVAGEYTFFPAARPDASGNVVVVYGESASSRAPEVVVAARTPDGAVARPVVIGASGGSAGSRLTNRRWGDYFGIARDPSNPTALWAAGETWKAGVAGGSWTSAVASVSVAARAPVLPTAPPALHARPGSGIAGTTVRLTFRALGDGSGIRRDVTVRSRGKVVFRRTTRPGSLHAQRLYAVAWRTPRSLRGSLRFCVRAVLADGRRSASSCATFRLRQPNSSSRRSA